MTLPSYVSLLRILLIIPVCMLISKGNYPYNLYAFVIFILAAMTDYLDGYLARKFDLESRLGALLDLLADKLLVCIVLIWIIKDLQNSFFLFPTMLILARELIISSIRQFISEKENFKELKVSFLGKSKTTFQLITISFFILLSSQEKAFLFLGIMLWCSSLISIYSLFDYIYKWKDELSG